MTALTDTVALIQSRHQPVVSAYGLAAQAAVLDELAAEALTALGLSSAAAALGDASLPSMRLALDVVVWRWIEGRAALGYDFSADGGSYSRSQLAAQATRMRILAEARAAAAGLTGFGAEEVKFDVLTW